MNYPSFPLSKVTEDLEKELDLDFSSDDNTVRQKNLIPKKDINKVNETRQTLISHVCYRKVYSTTKGLSMKFFNKHFIQLN